MKRKANQAVGRRLQGRESRRVWQLPVPGAKVGAVPGPRQITKGSLASWRLRMRFCRRKRAKGSAQAGLRLVRARVEGGGEVETDRGQRRGWGSQPRLGERGWVGEDSKERKNPLGRSVGKHGSVWELLPLHALLCPSSVPLLCPWAHAWPISSRFLVIGDGEDPTGINGTEEPSSLIQACLAPWVSQEDNNYSSSNRANKYSRRISN